MKPTNSELSFANLVLQEALLKNLITLGYEVMTPIQMQSLPIMLKGQDIIAQAKTGSGKTVAFGLSLLNSLKVGNFNVQGLILCPTRELADQVCQVLRRLARQMHNVKILNLSGGVPMGPQIGSLRHGAHIVVGTPGRIQKHLANSGLSLHHLQTLVLDEADRMLDMGFLDEITAIISACPKKRQTLLFSATYPNSIRKLSQQFMRDAKEVTAEETHTQQEIEQIFYKVDHQANKFSLLKNLLLHYKPISTLIFCNTKQQAAQLAELLNQARFSALALHGDMEQKERDQMLIRFMNQSCSILVATDVAARGLDIKELPAVINYDLAFDHLVHVHRIGRTGRAGSKGLALSLVAPFDSQRIEDIKNFLNEPLHWGNSAELIQDADNILKPPMITLCIDAGKKNKIRPGDILGALTKDAALPAEAIGKIDITTFSSYVAIQSKIADKAYHYLKSGKLKGRTVKVKKL